MPRADASSAVLDAAERMFAEHGIAPVSDRKIAEAAGNSNHSAVRYYFGGRDGLLGALLDRHLEDVEPDRAARFAASDSLLGDVRSLVIPVTDVLATLEVPSYRARFLRQAHNDPATVALMRSNDTKALTSAAIMTSIGQRLGHLDRRVVEGRGRVMTQIVVSACADIEESDGADGRWSDAGDFLCDAIVGLLQAPITRHPTGS